MRSMPIKTTLAAPRQLLIERMHRTSRDLTDAQRSLLQVMREHQFGRIEMLPVQDGQPVLDRSVRIVRVARLGGQRSETEFPVLNDFELNQSVCNLFAELRRLQNATILTLEFRHGLPWLLETSEVAPSCPGSP
jgi:hypothetical protein